MSLSHPYSYIPELIQEQIYGYGLHLIDQDLRRHDKCLQDFPSMPRPQLDWSHQKGNQLINEQLAYDIQEQQDHVERGLTTLNAQQSTLYHAVIESVLNSHGSTFFLHSSGGCGKTYLAKLIAAGVCATGRIVHCVASTGVASLLLPGGHTAHSCFKIPILCHDQSTCNIKKDDAIHKLLKRTSIVIWDKIAS